MSFKIINSKKQTVSMVNLSTSTGTQVVDVCKPKPKVSYPKGTILMFVGNPATLGTDWVLCNGKNHTPNLNARFLRGTNSGANVGHTTGSANDVVVSHGHSVATSAAGNHHHATTRKYVHSGGGGYHRHYTPLTYMYGDQGVAYSHRPGGEKFFIGTAWVATGGVGNHTHSGSAALHNSNTVSHTHAAVRTSASGGGATGQNIHTHVKVYYIMKRV